MAKWETKWGGEDSQDVGLEAATIQRKRNSSLVQSPCAENVTGLKPCTEATGGGEFIPRRGRRAFHKALKAAREVRWSHWKREC